MDAQTGEVLRAAARRSVCAAGAACGISSRSPSATAAGKVVATRYFRFCPNALDRQAIGTTSADAALPGQMPVRLAVRARDGLGHRHGLGDDRVRLPQRVLDAALRGRSGRGSYTATVRIAPRYQSLFEVPAGQAEVTVDFTVERASSARRALHRRTAAGSGPPAEVPPTMDDPDPSLLPDLVALPAWNIELFEGGAGKNLLTFAASPWNAGPGPLVVEGFRRPDTDIADAYQSFYDGETAGRANPGRHDRLRLPAGPQPLAFPAVLALQPHQQGARARHAQPEAIVLPDRDRGDRPDRPGRVVEAVVAHVLQRLRRAERDMAPRGDAGRLGGHVLPDGRRPGLRRDLGPERPLLDRDRDEPAAACCTSARGRTTWRGERSSWEGQGRPRGSRCCRGARSAA